MEDRIYYREFECYHSPPKGKKMKDIGHLYYDLALLPSQKMREEYRAFLMERGKDVSIQSMAHDKSTYHHLCHFLKSVKKRPESFSGWEEEIWIGNLKKWMLKNGMPWYREKTSVYGSVNRCEAQLLRYVRHLVRFFQPEDNRAEKEKDIWELDRLGIPVTGNPIHNVRTINFTRIYQQTFREEIKEALYHHIPYESIGTVQGELGGMRRFSRYLKEQYPDVESSRDIDRKLIEDYLIYNMTNGQTNKSKAANIYRLRSVLTTIGKLYGYPHLESIIIQSDIPPEMQPEFKVYSDAELKRLNAEITKMDEQLARCMIIHQMLGTRISDTLTLRQDCLYQNGDQTMIRIQQVKTDVYKKPVSGEVVLLIQKAIEYTKSRYGNTAEYIFVSEKDINRPLQYTTIKNKVLQMIRDKKLLDDDGKPFGFNSHMFRHYYGVKLTELHLDDWTIAKLLGHKRLGNVKYYRKMSNQRLADETRKARDEMSRIILNNLEGWGNEYEQIR